MELTDLKVFVTVAEEGSVSRAAERLEYVQSNVTARIRKLESEIGVALFFRHPKGVTLTDKGIVFREYALSILNLSEESLRAVREKSYPSGPLSIGVVETVTCGNFMNALSAFQNRYPDVTLSLITGASSELLSMVLANQLDGAFVTGGMASSKLVSEYEMRDELVLLTTNQEEAYPDLSNTKWAVSPKGCPFRTVLEQWLHREGIAFDNMIEIGSLETLLSCVRAGLASTLLPTSVLTGDYQSLAAYPIPEKFRFTNTNLVRRKDRFYGKAFAAFAEMINQSGL
ncbi:LysR family transcriptional regulator [Paenibacillus allorhizosphaerae]|uniref:HTH-type transcriptional regulator GltR n=1 Tax=Paenibacillus allorhizosphaerae TaxID=2849866 RepID=A0ABN7TRU0_9BACL|nr:LysR family transcriptional regulator [Paenibacillus allorhizosphaerae]CAG7648565.1 HTH-type transcriptional regulator GltR [Paenibacillus allorhizosphaerae]